MKIVITILSIIIFLKTLSYGIFEIKEKNKSGGITVIVVSVVSLVLPIVMVYIKNL